MNARSLRILPITLVALLFAAKGYGQGETCATAVPVTPGTYIGDGPSSGSGIDNSCFGFGGFNGDWYSFTPVVDGTFTVGACNGGTDTRLSVFTGTCGALSCYGSSDDFCQMYQGGSFYASEVSNLPATAGTTYYIQWDDNWVQNGYTWYLNFFCANAPTASYTVLPDCPNNQFSVMVDITGLGSAASVDITNNGGAPPVSGVGLGQYTTGPFVAGTPVQLTLVNNSDIGCDGYSPALVNFTCPIVSCGPDNYTYCYGNSTTYTQVFQGNSTYPLLLHFNSGFMYQFGGDLITIYDGLDNTGLVLYSGFGDVLGNMAGISVTSTNPDHALTLVITSDGFTSCQDGGVTGGQLDYTVGCLDCTPPGVTGFTVNTDCVGQVFTVDVNITSIGTDPNVEIANNVGVASSFATSPGVVTAGPFPVGVPATITLVNDQNALCNVVSQPLVNTFCPINITCGEPSFDDSYCYQNSDSHYWIYHNTGTQPLAILFSQGWIETNFYDNLRIYDGEDNTGTLLYQHGGVTENLAGLLAISQPGHSLYMEMSSDGSVSCATQSFGAESEWLWTVGCLDCLQSQVSYDVVLDCPNSQFFVATTVSDLGSDVTPTITNNGGAPEIPITGTGTYNVGPFAFGTQVRVKVENDENGLCTVQSPVITNAPCPLVDCGPNSYTYCYHNGLDSTVVYQSATTYPIAMIFNSGALDTYGDSIYVWDGANYLATQIYAGVNNYDLSGLLFTSSNPANALTVKFKSDPFFGSCVDLGLEPWNWTVSCLDCTNPVADFEMVPDCQHHGFNIRVQVDSVGVNAPMGLMIANSYDADTIHNIGVGLTTVGPFPVDEVVHLTVMNENNPLCRKVSPDYTYPMDSCIITACSATGTEYCYANHDTAWFTYTSGTADPITLQFGWGQMLVNDYIQIYNGLDTAAQLVYMGNQGGNLAGLAITSNNAANALTLLVISSQVGSCATGQAISSYWTVGCGLVGMSDVAAGDFAMFPNPTTGDLYIRLPEAASGRIHMDVIDMTGRILRSETYTATSGTNARYNMSELPAGNYTVRLTAPTWTSAHALQVLR